MLTLGERNHPSPLYTSTKRGGMLWTMTMTLFGGATRTLTMTEEVMSAHSRKKGVINSFRTPQKAEKEGEPEKVVSVQWEDEDDSEWIGFEDILPF
jgi:hypothetical protein